VIDNNIYPVKEGEYSDLLNRPIAIGVQGLADVFFKFKVPFTSDKAKEINKLIAETMYYAALSESNNMARNLYTTYKNYSTSMSAKGILQYDLWGVTPSNLWNWEELKEKIKYFGLYNSLLIALMPTASTSQILGNYEMFEPITSNMFIRSTLSGTFQIINKYLINDLMELNLWNDTMKQKIIANDGSVQNIPEIPKNIREIYKTVWELKQRDLIDMDRDRGAYVCHSSSSNRYVKNPTDNKLTSMHMYSWKVGLKTGCYYLRSQSDANAVKFNVDVKILKQTKENQIKKDVIEEEECLVCSA
jgi:ribonucleoside-diphosphate reductase alpha chain